MSTPVYATILSLALLVITFTAAAQPTPQALEAKVDSLFAVYARADSPGASVSVVRDGQILLAKGYGQADLEFDSPITAQTPFHVASVSKQFTAFGIVLLAQQGKLTLDDDIRKHLPEMPDFGQTITIRHLVHHTSGLRDQWNLLGMAGWRLDDVITKDQILRMMARQKELNFSPGTEHLYCNTGYTLLAEIVARVGGKPFPAWMAENVFQPLGMTNTLFYDDHERIVRGRAYSYSFAGLGYKKAVLSYANAGATSLFTTAEDMTRWMANFGTGQVGGTAAIEQMMQRGVLNSGDTLSYAFGLAVGRKRGLQLIEHSGGDAGYRSYMLFFPDQKLGIAVLSNLGNVDTGGRAHAIADFILAGAYPEAAPQRPAQAMTPVTQKEIKLPPAILDRYVGDYELEVQPGFILSFRRDGDRFLVKPTGQNEAEVFASSDSTFFVKIVDARVTFSRDRQGKVTHMTLYQNGSVRAFPVKRVMLDESRLAEYTGRYFSPELETAYVLVVRDGKLIATHQRHDDVELTPTTEDRFGTATWFLGQIHFERNASGKITGLRMTSGRVRNVLFVKQ